MNRTYTLESIQARADRLRGEVKSKELRLRSHYHEIFAPPAPATRVETIVSHVSSAYALIDGFMTGYKLLKTLFGGRRRSRRR